MNDLAQAREEMAFQAQTLAMQLESSQQQAKTSQAQHWSVVRRLKEAESQLLDEVDKR